MNPTCYKAYKESEALLLGSIPFHWEIKRVKRVAPFKYGDALDMNARNEAGSVPVVGSNGQFDCHDTGNAAGPCIVIGRKGSFGVVTWYFTEAHVTDTAFFVDTTAELLRWVYWALLNADLKSVSQDTGVPGLSRDDAHQVQLAIPTRPEQKSISYFLDHETVKIDALIAEQERLLKILEEKRQAVISRAVTCGLNPKVPVKESGLEWLGEVPMHWRLCRLKHVASTISVGVVVKPSQYYAEAGINDTTARDLAKKHGGQWFKCKSLDGHGPTGPWIVPAAELDVDDLHLQTRVNGIVKQEASTGRCISRSLASSPSYPAA